MKITRRNEGDVEILCLEGKLDLIGASEFKDASRDILSRRSCKIVVNMGRVNYVSSSGLGALVSILKAARNSNGELKLSDLAPGVKVIFELTQLSDIFDIRDSEKNAVSSFR